MFTPTENVPFRLAKGESETVFSESVKFSDKVNEGSLLEAFCL